MATTDSSAFDPDYPVIQRAYDLVRESVPVIHRMARDHRFSLGESGHRARPGRRPLHSAA